MHSKFSTIRLLEVPSLCHSYLTCTPIGYVVKPRDPTACWKNAGVCPYELIAHLLRARPIVTQPNKPLNVLLPQKVQSTGCISFLSSPYFPPAPKTNTCNACNLHVEMENVIGTIENFIDCHQCCKVVIAGDLNTYFHRRNG